MIILRSIYLSIAILLLSTTELAAQDTTRGMVKKEGFPNSQSELKYRKKWAVVVGINYSREDRAQWKDRGDITDLRRAENDARSVAQILKTKYGYEEECVKLLLGKAATRDAIADLLMDGLFCDPKQVGPEDSILFYFSGHGYGPGQSDSESPEHVYLVPCDAKVDKDARLGAAHAIDLNQMVEAMGSKKCVAPIACSSWIVAIRAACSRCRGLPVGHTRAKGSTPASFVRGPSRRSRRVVPHKRPATGPPAITTPHSPRRYSAP